ncbi:integrase family protein [Laribacter hongkongensis]|uniref:Integrase family protein n=1 Tax=Laribacter hongkongensis TaxID=168471 RepID=A0ABD4STR9_9NEIS|nr:integrase family protein [Laribacter hongkongensis]MCG9026402.1 integrase family protein [Laribacter hongkongensis]MCG9054433.1 integrase family protein [Laribacter hongkongensis]
MQASLTDKLIQHHVTSRSLKLESRTDQRYELRDTTIRGLCLRLGTRSQKWCIHVTIKKRHYRVSLGSWPCITTEEARRRALDWLYRHRERWNNGRLCHASPSADQAPTGLSEPPNSTPPPTTLSDVLALYIQHKALKPVTERSYRDSLKFHLNELADQPVESLNGSQISKLYKKLLSTLKPATANLHIRVLRALYRFWFALNGRTPPDLFSSLTTLGSKRVSGVRTRYLSEDDLRQLGQKWHLLTQSEQDFMLIALCTGFRLSELKSLSAQSYNQAKQTLHLPTTKNGKPHTIPVPKQLQPVLERLLLNNSGRFLSGHIHNYASIISRKIGVEFSCHDLRRTFATHAAKIGISLYMIKSLLNHSQSSDVTKTHYVHLSHQDMTEAIQKIADFMTEKKKS